MTRFAAIRIDGLTKFYGRVIGIEDLSLEVEQGEVFGYLGANGAGKTTTIRLLLDLLRPSRGTASVLGHDCHRESLAARRMVGYLPGELPVYPDLTAGAYLAFLSRLDGRIVDAGYLRTLLRQFDVSEIDLGRRLRDQSHGMKQKIGIVQALMARPPLVILDEPTAGLDPFMVQAFRHVLEDLRRQGTTVFLSSHVLTEVEATCDRVGIVRGGRVVDVSALAELKSHSPRRVDVTFGWPVECPSSWPTGVTLRAAGPMLWELNVAGPVGPLMQMLGEAQVADIAVESFSLERHVMAFYGPAGMNEGRPA